MYFFSNRPCHSVNYIITEDVSSMREGGVSVQRVELTGRQVALLSEMNYRRFFDSWCRLCGKYRLCQVNFEKASIFGQRQSAWPFWEQLQFLLFHLFCVQFPFSLFLSFFLALFLSLFFVHFLLSFLYFLSFLHSHLSCLCLLLLTYKCVTVASANRHNSCLSTHSTVRTAFLLLLEYLYKFIGGCLY